MRIQSITFRRLLILAIAICATVACNKSVSDRTANLAPLNPANQDLNAGNWKLVLLSRPDTFPVVAPAATSSTGYLADLFEIKGYQKKLSGDELGKIRYWSAGGVLRWNEIMRSLTAKYNVPPYQNADGSYPIPSSTNPFAYPYFPFSNPPYAARAFAYVSAAQYDALVACWHYKQQYNRPAPYMVDSSIKAYANKTTLPSYPSEAAVLAGVSAEMMKLLYPDEIASVEAKLQEAELAAIESGAATRSDITAGEALGRQVAQAFIARGRADNAGKAVGTPTDWANFATQAQAAGQTPWLSLDAPSRPPMLPLFGKVKGFLVDSAHVVALRPGPPPSTNSADMQSATSEVYNLVKTPSREQMRIVQFWADGVGTYTPPGHWDAIAAEDFIKKNFSEVRWARNFALLNMAEMDAAIVCWDVKYHYFNPRPSQLNGQIKTLTGVPNFPSYISGHSTFSGAAAAILGHIVPERASAYMSMAQEASNSRVIGGIHYRTDCSTGLTVGQGVGNFAIQRATTDGAE
ncbi:MAG: phosphatase PAP2 family protein [Bacteroidota bacterium]|nr:phosphatase PAP2 family protein [Bacteroidota bacterium]MDP4216288.1 phosphatase PAP2 family protein [Bacteroidota bacterium]MDP4244453.1 phosphatase PAP2 family protein [Bacteroidota bacterium]MDP4255205.1 phosphatase PAP2 family protein [Bacteroidota bacterium]MDP4258182.1 phosphatase PAP2 family protein [Bacteroidota bacterium]